MSIDVTAAGATLALARLYRPGGSPRRPIFDIPEDEWKLVRDVIALNVAGDYDAEIEPSRKILRVAVQGNMNMRRVLGQMLKLAAARPDFPHAKKLALIAAAYDVHKEVQARAAAIKREERAAADDRIAVQIKPAGWTCGKCSAPVAGRYDTCKVCGHPEKTDV